MQIKWLGHACFRVESGDWSVILDPYAPGSVPGLPDVQETADTVLCSHGHGDHGYAEAVTLSGRTGGPLAVTAIPSWHDEVQGAKRGPNTIHVLAAEGLRVAHMGDIGCDLTDAQLAEIGRLDAVLLPIGGFFTVDAREAKALADKLGARVVIPMHYRSDRFGFDKIGTLDAFTALWPDGAVRYLDGDVLTLTADTPAGVAVPTLP